MTRRFGTGAQSNSPDLQLPYCQRSKPTAQPLPVEVPPFACENVEYTVEFV